MNPITPAKLDVLMYHSISDGPGPTCIPPHIFRMQLDTLAAMGYQSVSLTDVVRWWRGEQSLPLRGVVITFDDGFSDFATAAWNELQSRGFAAVVFLPTGMMGGCDDWEVRANEGDARRLMQWHEVEHLAAQEVEFGAHTVHHVNLATLPLKQAEAEIVQSKETIEERLGKPVLAFAPPYGRTNKKVRRLIRQNFLLSFGTVLARVHSRSDAWDLPRVEMHYFRRHSHWQAYLSGEDRLRSVMRRSLRAVRQLSTNCLDRVRSGSHTAKEPLS